MKITCIAEAVQQRTAAVRARGIVGLVAAVALLSSLSVSASDNSVSPNPQDALRHLFDQQLQTATSENVVFAPLSLTQALLAAADGADGRTRRAFERTLGLGKGSQVNPTAFERHVRDGVLRAVADAESNGIAFASPNKLWVAKATVFDEDFLQRQQSMFGSTPSAVDFANPATVQEINDWVRRETRDRIPMIVDRLDPGSQFALVNATYFKGEWAIPFDPKLTRARPFHLASGAKIDVSMMRNPALKAAYAKSDAYEAVKLSFKGSQFTLTIVLPNRGATPAFPTDFQQIKFAPGRGQLVLPRFDLTGGGSLTELLRGAGLAEAFDPCADFSRMSEERIRLSEVIQKTTLTVTEEGAEAAAATAVLATRSAVREKPVKFDMVVNRPFFVVVEHAALPVPIMMARVAHPK